MIILVHQIKCCEFDCNQNEIGGDFLLSVNMVLVSHHMLGPTMNKLLSQIRVSFQINRGKFSDTLFNDKHTCKITHSSIEILKILVTQNKSMIYQIVSEIGKTKEITAMS